MEREFRLEQGAAPIRKQASRSFACVGHRHRLSQWRQYRGIVDVPTIDDVPFLINAPFFLDPGALSGPFVLFNVTIDAATPPGTYDFNFFQILWGLDGNAFDTIGSAMFSVIVVAPAFSVPEPAPLWLVGLVAVGFTRGRGLISRRAGSAASVRRCSPAAALAR